MSKKNRNRTQTNVASMNTAAVMEATDVQEDTDTTTDTKEVSTESVESVAEPTEEVTSDMVDIKRTWISDIVRNGLPEDLVDTTFTVCWQSKIIEIDLRDCDILKVYGYPFVGNERRADFAVPHYLGLATKKLYLPCSTDGKFVIEEFTGRKGTELLNAYFRKMHDFIEDQNQVIRHIFDMKDSEVETEYNRFIANYTDSKRIKP